jgi:hypothetical protein
MPLFSILKNIRQILSGRSTETGKARRTLRLVQLEDRRMLNATFAFNGVATLDLAGFTSTTSQLAVSDTGGDLVFTLDAGTWSAGGGADDGNAGITGAGTGTLTVAKSLFEDAGDILALNIDAQIAGASNVNLILSSAIVLPNSPTDGLFQTQVDGNATFGFALDGSGNNLSLDAAGSIVQNAALTNIGTVDYDAGTTIGITAPITASGTVDVDSTGLTTIGALGDINAGGAVTFGAVKIGALTTAGDIDTTDDNVTFTRSVTLSGNVDTDTTGTAAGNIHFLSTISTGGNNLSLDAGAAGNMTLDGAASGGGDFVVRDGAVHNYSVLSVDSVDILDATTSVTFNGAVNVSANNANGGTDAFKVNTPGLISIDGTITATSAAGLNIDVDPTNINVNADILATGQIDLTASNNIIIAAVTVRADTDGIGGGTLNITADDDASGAGNLTAVDGSTLRGHTVNLGGFDITTDVVTSDVGNLSYQAANAVALNDATTTNGGLIDIDAVTSVTSSGVGTMTTTAQAANGASGAVDIDAGTSVTLSGNIITTGVAINGAGGNVNIDTVNGSITVSGIEASGAGAGAGGNIILDADGVNADVAINSGLSTNGAAFVTITADDAITMAAAGSISSNGTGSVSVTSNTAVTDGDSGDGITMAAGSSINAGTGTAMSGTILLQSTGANGGSIQAQGLTTRNNTITITSGDGIALQAAVNSNGGLIDIDAVTSVTSSGVGTMTTTAQAANGASGAVDIDAGTSVTLSGNIITTGVAINGAGGNVNIDTVNGSITVSGIEASGAGAGAGGNIILDADGVNADVAINSGLSTNGAAFVTITADDAITMAAAGSISSNGTGSVSVTSNTAVTDGDSGDGITMADGAFINAVTGSVSLTALGINSGNITLGSVRTGNATAAAVVITTTNGNIIDGGDADIDIVTTNAGSTVTLTATNGHIGALSGDVFKGTVEAIEVDLAGNFTATAFGVVAISGNVAGAISVSAETFYFNSTIDISVPSITMTGVVNLVLITPGRITVPDAGLAVTGDMRIEADDVDAVTALNPVLLGSGATRIDRLLYRVTNAADEYVSVFTDQLDVLANSNIQVHVNGNTQLTDLNCDLTSFNTNGNTAVIVAIGGTITQGTAVGTNPGTQLNDRLLSQNLLLLGDGTNCLDHQDNNVNTIAGQLVGNASLYFNDIDALTVGTVSSLFAVPAPAFAVQAYNGLQTANGDIHVRAGGTLTVDQAVSAGLAGNVLMAATDVTSDVIVNAGILTGTGHMTLNAGRNIDLNATATTTGAGTVSMSAGNNIDVDAIVSTEDGDILVQATENISQTALITTTNGDVGLVTTTGNITQTATGDVTTTIGDVLVDAGNNWTMAGDPLVVASNTVMSVGGQDFVGRAGNTISLGIISMTNASANRVALEAVTGSITDANAAMINIEETLNAAATSVSLRAGGIIGAAGGAIPAVNDNAIDLNVDTVAANAATGIYLREIAAGLDITVDNVNAVTVNVDVSRVDFKSTTTDINANRTLAALEDLRTVPPGGPIKLVAENGTITVNGGSTTPTVGIDASGTGDVLLEARGAASDVIVNAGVSSGTGHITFNAGDDIDLNASVSTGGSGSIYLLAANGTVDAVGPEVDGINVNGTVTTAAGDILLNSALDIRTTSAITSTTGDIGLVAARDVLQGANVTTVGDVVVSAGRDVTMGSGTSTTGGTNVLVDSEGTIRLGLVSGTNVSLDAVGDILDNNGGSVTNVRGTNLRMVAGGTIGTSDLASPVGTNNNAIDTEVVRVAAGAGTGIYIQEVVTGGSLIVDEVNAVTVNVDVFRVNFNSTTTAINANGTLAAFEDLRTTNDGPIKLVAENGTITVNGGSITPTIGVSANGTGDVLLEARGAASDVIVHAGILTGTGHMTLNAGRNIDLNATATTTGAGTVSMSAGNNIDVDAIVSTEDGDILVQATENISQTALITTTNGDVGLVTTTGNITQTATGDVTTTIGDVLVDAGNNWTMAGDPLVVASNTVMSVGGQDFVGRAGNTISLGIISMTNASANRVALEAVTGSITDANAAMINIEETLNAAATSVSLRAGGIIGAAGGAIPAVNDNAIDLNVDTVAANAATGIYLREIAAGLDITVDNVNAVTVNVDVSRVDFKSTTTDINANRTLAALEDLRTVPPGGPIKLVAENGTITVNGGSTTPTVGIDASGTGDVLLEARGAASDVIVNAGVSSGTGHITFNAGDDIDLNASVSTGGSGSIYLLAANGTVDAVGPEVDGINVNGTVTTAAGDILLNSALDIRTTSAITSTTGDIGLVAARDVLQGANVTTVGDVVVSAGRDVTMGSGTSTTGGTNVLVDSEGTIRLGLVSGTNVSLDAVGDILDNNGGSVTNVRGTNLRMVAGGTIGTSDLASPVGTNNNAIDTEVVRVAAGAGTGIYIQEVVTGGSLIVDEVNAVTVNVDVFRVNFNSTTTAINANGTLAAFEDLRTTNDGPIKLVAENGTITVNGGSITPTIGVSANGTGDVLLEARGAASDVIVHAGILTGTGHMTLNAADDIDLNANVVTSGTGTVYLFAGNNMNDAITGIDMASGTSITTGGGNVRFVADNEGDIRLGLINVSNGSVTLIAEGDILDNNGASVLSADAAAGQNQLSLVDASGFAVGDVLVLRSNSVSESHTITATAGNTVTLSSNLTNAFALADQAQVTALNFQANALRMWADAVVNTDGTQNTATAGNNVGIIGLPTTGNGIPSANINAIDTQVTTLAAQSADGIYVRESDSLIVDSTGDITVQQVNLNSTLTALTDLSLNDLVTTDDVRVADRVSIQVVALNGTLTVNQGTNGASGVAAQGNDSQIHLEASGNVVINADVTAGTAGTTANVDSTLATPGEQIVIRSVSGNILIGTSNAVTISTDEDLTPGESNVLTSDRIQLLAGSQSPLSSDAVAGQNQLTLTSAAGFSVGDVVVVDDGDSATQVVTITAISGNTLTLNSNLTNNYSVPQNAFVAHQNLGALIFGTSSNVTLRTDGGVAHQFAARPQIGVADPNSAFVVLQTTPFNAVINNQALAGLKEYLNVWELQIGVTGEENLRLDVDWRDPVDSNAISNLAAIQTAYGLITEVNSDRTQTFYLSAADNMNRIGHIYTFDDLRQFAFSSITSFLNDFSVSQHDSILVSGGTVQQGALPAEVVANTRISSTDNIGTATPLPAVPAIIDVTNEADANRDFNFEGGLIKMLIPTIFPPPMIPEVAPPALPAPPVAAPAIVVPVLVNVAPVEISEVPLSSYSTQSQDYFQLREFDGVTRKVIEKYEHIPDEFGELLLQPARLKQWVIDENFADQPGLELWLITEKRTINGAVTVERPVLKFDIANGQPFPANETMPDVFEDLRLSPMPLDDNLNTPEPGAAKASEPVIDRPSSESDNQPQDGDRKLPEAEGQSLSIPSIREGDDSKSEAEADVTVSSTMNQSILLSVAVSSVLNQSCVASVAPSKSRQLLNRILNRQR